MSINIAHRIELKPNNKQKTYFRKAFGCTRLAWNWGLAEWQRQYKEGDRPSAFSLKKQFNAIKGEQYPFVYEVTKYATQQPFIDLEKAYKKFFKEHTGYPRRKRKKDNEGSFYIGGDQCKLSFINTNSKSFRNMAHNERCKRQYFKVPNLGCVKMTECIRFNGKINGAIISQEGGKFYASFSMEISEEEYKRTHPHSTNEKRGAVGIDLGIKNTMALSNGIAINNPKPLAKYEKKIKRLSRQLDKRVHARTKQERLKGVAKSNNYHKLSVRLAKAQARVANIRRDYLHKVTTALTCTYSEVAMEDLNTKGMMKNHKLAKALADVSFGKIKELLKYKAAYNGSKLVQADRFYASSQLCSACGYQNKAVKDLKIRKWTCPQCGTVHDRDHNAAKNILSLVSHNSVGTDYPEFTPADLTALLSLLTRCRIATSKVELGRQQNL
ncbi:MAG: transposase [Bacteroidaceae bacterium]|nr:transposase [Bacteroidaceae bacterium]